MNNKTVKKVIALLLCTMMVLGSAPLSIFASAADEWVIDPKADPSTSDISSKFPGVASDDGKILTDKTVRYNTDEFDVFSDYEEDEFSIALSALGQSYPEVESEEITTTDKVHPDVIFVIDESGSMRQYTVAGDDTVCRGEATASALNGAIKALYQADPETRIGIVSFGHDYNEVGVYLPLDKYTLPEGQEDYILWDGRNNAVESAGTLVATGTVNGSNIFYYPSTNTFSTTETTSQVRYRVTTGYRVRKYDANSTSSSSSYTLADGGSYTIDGYTFTRSGSRISVSSASVNENENTYEYEFKTVSDPTTITLATSTSAANTTSGIKRPSNVTLTQIATVNGVTYYGYCYYSTRNNSTTYNSDYIYVDNQQGYTCLLSYNGDTVYVDENITITREKNSAQITYTTNTYTKKTAGAEFEFEEIPYLMSTNYLINSAGEVVRPSSYKFLTGIGTFTQAGLQAAENMFGEYAAGDLSHRVPAVVLISDGIPTLGDSNVKNPSLKIVPGTTSGNGLQSGTGASSNDLCNLGLYTIQTGVKVKNNVQNLYAEGGATNSALFYSIGPGVDYPIGKLILSPDQENMEVARQTTTAGGNEAGAGIPRDLYDKIIAADNADELDYVDYVDWSYTGDMSTDELSQAFLDIVSRLTSISRPITTIETEETSVSALEANAGMIITDKLGDGMKVDGNPVIVYGGQNYQMTGSSSSASVIDVDGEEQTVNVTLYTYNYIVTEESTGKKYDMSKMVVEKLVYPDGTQEIKWFIPAELVPIIYHDVESSTYKFADPIRLVYKVGLQDGLDSGEYYTNSTEDPATAEFTPAFGNPYYYDTVVGEDGKKHTTLKSDNSEENEKTDNVTDTLDNSYDADTDSNGKVTAVLGNNGVEEIEFTELSVRKIWDDNGDAAQVRPESISVSIYRNGTFYADRIITEADSVVSKDADGNDVWTATVKGLPYNENVQYTIEEAKIDGYTTTYADDGDTKVITNSVIKGEISYQLYLVDENGTPIDENGNFVTFETRTNITELVTVDSYINSTTVIDEDDLQKLLPDGYFLFNPDSSFVEELKGVTASDGSKVTITDSTNTTKVFDPSGATTGNNGTVTGINDYTDVKVAFAVYKIDLSPIVIVADYGKPITTYPLEKDNRGFKVNGITAQAPAEGLKTSDKVTLKNGVAALVTDVTHEVPKGDIVGIIGTGDTLNFYPRGERVTEIVAPGELRYSFAKGVITKYDAQTGEGTAVSAGINDKSFAYDEAEALAFYRDGEKIYVIKNPVCTPGEDAPEVETETVFAKYAPKSSGQVLEEGDYYFTNTNIRLVTGTNITGGGIVGSSDFTISGDVLTTSQDAVISVTVANSANNTYYLRNSKGQYLSITKSDSSTGAAFTSTKTAVRVLFNSNAVTIVNATNNYYFNRYGGDNSNTYGAYNQVDAESLFDCYKKTTREVVETYYALTGATESKTTTGLSSNSYTTVLTLPDTTYFRAKTSSGKINIYLGNSTTALFSVSSSTTKREYTYTSDNILGKDGNPLSITVTFERASSSSVKASYTTYEEKEETVTVEPTPGTIEMRNSLDSVTYAPFRYMSSIDRVFFFVCKGDFGNTDESVNRLYSTITYIPATTVYYEDNFGGSSENGGLYIKYTGDWYTITDNGSKTSGTTAKADSDETQDRGEVGDGHAPYGYDSSYDGDTRFSDGTAAVVEGTMSMVNGKPSYNAYATFTFTGTGFDIISRTDLDCGMITVLVHDHETGEFVAQVPVINKGVNNLYQIPVVSFTDYVPYGTYDVTINVNAPSKLLGIEGSTFYLDAIRIYDPMGKSSADNDEYDEAYAAYQTDKEANAFVASIRDFIIQAGSLDSSEQYGAVYVDTLTNDYDIGGMIGNIKNPEFTEEERRTRAIDKDKVNTLQQVGPNEEVYLSPGYGVGFIVESNMKPESVQLEIKMPTPESTDSFSTLSAQTYGVSSSQKNFKVASSTEMFYDITDAVVLTESNGLYRATVILSNGLPNSAQENEIVSITNIKMTYAEGTNVVNNAPKLLKASAANPEPFTPEYAYNAEMEALAKCNVAVTSLKASENTYKQVFDTVYVQRQASTPVYDVVNAKIADSTVEGNYEEITFNTAIYVDEVEIVDENGVKLFVDDVNCRVDESKRFTDDYMNTKTWTAKVKVPVGEGVRNFTVKAVNGEGAAETMPVVVAPSRITKLEVVKAPEKTAYKFGDEIITNGLELKATYNNGEIKTVTEGFTLENTKADTEGNMSVGVEFEGSEAQFNVTVKKTFIQKLVSFFTNIFSFITKLF